MRKYLSMLLTLILSCLCLGAVNYKNGSAITTTTDFVGTASTKSHVTGQTISSGVDYSDIIFWANADGTWDAGTSYTLGATECSSLTDADDACAINSDFVEETVAPLVGSSSFHIQGGWDYCTFEHTTAMPTGRIGFAIKFISGVDNSTITHFMDNDPVNRTGAFINSDDKVEAYIYDDNSQTTGVITTTSDYDANEHYGEVAWDYTVGAGSDYVKIYTDGSLEDTDATLTIDEAMTLTLLMLGINANIAGDYILDQVIISTDPDRDLNALKAVTDVTTLSGACP